MSGKKAIDYRGRVAEIHSTGKFGRICDHCAKAAGGSPPTDAIYIATYNFLVCDVCEQIKSVTSTKDWLWPWMKKPRRNRKPSGVSREA
jgi:hypothetical protein